MVEDVDRWILDLEYGLTLAARRTCTCGPYLIARHDVLIPAVLEEAKKREEDPSDTFARFATKLHAARCENQS